MNERDGLERCCTNLQYAGHRRRSTAPPGSTSRRYRLCLGGHYQPMAIFVLLIAVKASRLLEHFYWHQLSFALPWLGFSASALEYTICENFHMFGKLARKHLSIRASFPLLRFRKQKLDLGLLSRAKKLFLLCCYFLGSLTVIVTIARLCLLW